MNNQEFKNFAFTCSMSLAAASHVDKPSERKKIDLSANATEQENIRRVMQFSLLA